MGDRVVKILIKPNFEKTGSDVCARNVIAKLDSLGITPLMSMEDGDVVHPQECCIVGDFEDLLARCDILLTIGGDGTILRAVQASLRSGKPLLGINTGRLGFLSQMETDELDFLDSLAGGGFELLHRMMLQITLVDAKGEETFTALNDVVLSRGESTKLVEITVERDDGLPVATHRADGLIFATPTGSTAYNLSAGGCIAHPSLNLILMTAICPHSHFNHSLILSPSWVYKAREVSGNNRDGLVLMVDGNRMATLRDGAYIKVTRAEAMATFVDLGMRDFYQSVDNKLRIGK